MDSFRKLSVAAERCFAKVLGVYELQPAETSDPALLSLGQRLNVKFVTDDHLDCIDFSYDQPTPEQLHSARSIIIEELSVYPREVFEKTQIEQIILCTNLVIDRKRAGGTLKVGLHYVDTLFIDLTDLSSGSIHGRRTIHHELFHAIDFRDTWHGYVDADWTRIQGDSFRYEFDAAAELHRLMGDNPQEILPREFDDPYNRMSTSESDTPGFITDYARYSAAEDKAEVFCHLMVSYKYVMKRAAKDKVLKRKVERMKELLLVYIPEMDETFWKEKVAGRTI